MDVTVCVGTFGDYDWVELARTRAIPSAKGLGAPVIHRHGKSLAEARNAALAEVETPWVVALDADDELAGDFLNALGKGSADLRAPSVSYVRCGVREEPIMPRVVGHRHECSGECLPDGNWMVVGTAARTELLREVGGWEEWPWCEDWALWLKCWRAGASVEAIPDAVYVAHCSDQSRNIAPNAARRRRIHAEIVGAIGAEPLAA